MNKSPSLRGSGLKSFVIVYGVVSAIRSPSLRGSGLKCGNTKAA